MFATKAPELVVLRRPAFPVLDRLDPGRFALQVAAVLMVFWLAKHPMTAPLRLATTYLHEMGHALAALATGGSVQAICVGDDEGGIANTQGGMHMLILVSGYGLSALIGAMALASSQRQSHSGLACMAIVCVSLLGGVAFAMDRPTQQIGFLLASLSLATGFLCWRPTSWRIASLVLRLVGTFWVVWTVQDLYSDVWGYSGGSGVALKNDAVALSQIIGLRPTHIAAVGICLIYVVGLAAAVWSVLQPPFRVRVCTR